MSIGSAATSDRSVANPSGDADSGGRRRTSLAAFFVAASALVFVLKRDTLHEPPVWDASVSVFPAAIHLQRTAFDYPDLLRQPTFLQGGPNTHSLSLVTFVTAVAYSVLQTPDRTFPALHVLHYLLAAGAATTLFAMGRRLWSDGLAAAFAAAVLFVPLVRVQAGAMYLETPLLLCVALSIHAWARGRFAQAVGFALIACLVKSTAVPLLAALAASALCERRLWRQRLVRAGVVVGLPIAPVVFESLVRSAEPWPGYVWREYVDVFLRVQVVQRLATAPDALLLVALGAAAGGWCLWESLRGSGAETETRDVAATYRSRLLTTVARLLWLQLLFFVCVPLVVGQTAVLIRYYVSIVPFGLLLVVELAQRKLPRWAVIASLCAAAAFWQANRRGAYYAECEPNDISFAERSEEYQDALRIQRQAIDALAPLPPETPVLYGAFDAYVIRDPQLGYVERPPLVRACYDAEPYRHVRLADYPSDCYLIVFSTLAVPERIVKSLPQHPERRLDVVAQFRHGPHFSEVLRLSTRPAP